MPAITDGTEAEGVGVRIRAPAKINLTLHVTGQRTDGYHLLDSLVVFATVGDELHLQPASTLSLRTEGPEAADIPADMDNLVLKVARLFDDTPRADFALTKSLPVASGIGGGSADAAAAYRGLMLLRSGVRPGEDMPASLLDPDRNPVASRLIGLGADIPACLRSEAVRMRGIGEVLTPLPDLPPLAAILVNPRRPVSTPQIFKALARKDNAPMPTDLPTFSGPVELATWLRTQRNDLEAPAASLEPAISRVLSELASLDGCLLARMSGSGATCFGLFADMAGAEAGSRALRTVHPDWWVEPTWLGTMTDRAMPRIS